LDDIKAGFDVGFASKVSRGGDPRPALDPFGWSMPPLGWVRPGLPDPFSWLTGPCMDPRSASATPEGYPAAALDELRWSEARAASLKQRIAELEIEVDIAEDALAPSSPVATTPQGQFPSAIGTERPAGFRAKIIATAPLEMGRMLGLTVQDLVVSSIDDPRASRCGWMVGDRILRVNSMCVRTDVGLLTALEEAWRSYRFIGKAPVFEIWRFAPNYYPEPQDTNEFDNRFSLEAAAPVLF